MARRVNRRNELERMRDRLIAASKEAEAKELPAVSRELRQVMAELESLERSSGGSIGDELKQQRAKRVAGSKAQSR